MTTNQPRGFGRRLWWIIRTTLLIFILVALSAAVLGGLGYLGVLGVQEIQRSNDSLARRIDANEQNLNSLRDLVNSEFAQGNPEQQVQINQLQNELAALTAQLESLQAAQAQDTAVQAEQVGELAAMVETAVAQNSTLASDLEAVQAALVALQSDLNNTVVRADDLGGDLDQLRLQLGVLDDALTALNLETAETAARSEEGAPTNLQQTLTLLQLWGLLTNARLSVLDGDADSAETAVAQALSLSNSLTAEPDSPAAAALERLQTRLALAADGFATDLAVAAQDLEAASRELNTLLADSTSEAAEIETPLAATAETATPTPSATPLPTPTATP